MVHRQGVHVETDLPPGRNIRQKLLVPFEVGVSPATVSRPFSEPDMVRAPTRARIGRAAEELGYIRKRMAESLHNRFSGAIAIIVPTIGNAIFAELLETFSGRFQSHDRTMLIAAHG